MVISMFSSLRRHLFVDNLKCLFNIQADFLYQLNDIALLQNYNKKLSIQDVRSQGYFV